MSIWNAQMKVELRDFVSTDAEAVNQIALAAFQQYSAHYENWEQFSQRISSMASLAESAEIIVATAGEKIAGAVAYIAPGKPRASFFDPEWAVVRMLVVEPSFRGHGIGRLLTNECLYRAQRDGAMVAALHTSPIMEVALTMYLRMGFELVRTVPPIHGVPYGIYIKRLGKEVASKSHKLTQ